MHKTANNRQAGFGVIEVLLVLILIAIVGFTGYYVIHSQKQTTKTLKAANSSSQTSAINLAGSKTDHTAVSKDLVISEWGIRIPNGTDDTFTYSLNGSYAQLSTTKLVASDPSCSADKSATGVIQRATANDPVYEDGTTAAAAYGANSHSAAHIGNYYYVYTSPHAACSGDSSTNNLATAAIQALKSLVPLAEANK